MICSANVLLLLNYYFSSPSSFCSGFEVCVFFHLSITFFHLLFRLSLLNCLVQHFGCLSIIYYVCLQNENVLVVFSFILDKIAKSTPKTPACCLHCIPQKYFVFFRNFFSESMISCVYRCNLSQRKTSYFVVRLLFKFDM